MQFEHLVAVNDLTAQTTSILTRAQLWQGLLLRAVEPQRFNPHIEAVTILERSAHLMVREIDFGNMQVRDDIELKDGSEILYRTTPGEKHAGGQLAVRIEEPQEYALFVRFTYQTPAPENTPEEIELGRYLKKMWQEMDVDAIKLIRELAEEGRFNPQ
jgi:hypothetical protein